MNFIDETGLRAAITKIAAFINSQVTALKSYIQSEVTTQLGAANESIAKLQALVYKLHGFGNVSFWINCSPTQVEKGTTQSVTLSWNGSIKGPDGDAPANITKVDIKYDNVSISATPEELNTKKKIITGINKNTSFDITGTIDNQTYPRSASIKFYNKKYNGITNTKNISQMTATDILAGTDGGLAIDRNYNISRNFSNEYCWFAYPKSLGLIGTIKDGNNFDYDAAEYTGGDLNLIKQTFCYKVIKSTDINKDEDYYLYMSTLPLANNLTLRFS